MEDQHELIGESLIIALDGQKVAGKITAVHDTTYEVTLQIRQPAKGYTGVVASTVMPDGSAVQFDMGRHSFYSTLVIEVPRPRQARQVDSDEDKPAEDRRRFFRLATECEVEAFETLGRSGEYLRARGRTLNMSGGGMLVELNKPLLPGTYKWRVYMPNETLEVAGAVIRNKKQASLVMPVEFVDLHEVERSKLIRFIFNRMRNLREDNDLKKQSSAIDEPRYWRRREKYMKPPKPRYW
jgi:hypothetical protein